MTLELEVVERNAFWEGFKMDEIEARITVMRTRLRPMSAKMA